jgi:predicted MPP superfamily phosphohydrolase
MKSRLFLFPLILALLFYYSVFKVHHIFPAKRGLGWVASLFIFGSVMGWQVSYRLAYFSMDSLGFRILAWCGSWCLGLWATFVLCSLPLDLIHLVAFAVQKFIDAPQYNSLRRGFFSDSLFLGIGAVSMGSTALGFLEVWSGPKIKEVKVPIKFLPKELDGFRIAQISDLHIGSTIHRDYVQDVVNKVMSTSPDLIAVTGDLVDGFPGQLKGHMEPLKNLRAPLGTFYVTGNHEYYWGVEAWLDQVTQLGFTPLLNENRTIEKGGVKILVGGVTDTGAHEFVASHQSDPHKAGMAQAACAFRLLLAHRPSSCVEAESAGFDLQVSGHTHGGQFFPWSLLVRLAHQYYRGLNKHGKMWVYVNAGTGYWGPAHRFLIPSEITLIQLTVA